jgi:hypothetical protein
LRVSAALLCLWINLSASALRALVDVISRVVFLPHLCVDAPELDVMHQAIWIQLDRFSHVMFGLFD